MKHILDSLPENFDQELIDVLVSSPNVRIERIVSKGHTSPESGWYDQNEHEWVMVLEGSGTLLFDDGSEAVLNKGDFITIPAHTRHKVTRTDPDNLTLWLAVFYRD